MNNSDPMSQIRSQKLPLLRIKRREINYRPVGWNLAANHHQLHCTTLLQSANLYHLKYVLHNTNTGLDTISHRSPKTAAYIMCKITVHWSALDKLQALHCTQSSAKISNIGFYNKIPFKHNFLQTITHQLTPNICHLNFSITSIQLAVQRLTLINIDSQSNQSFNTP